MRPDKRMLAPIMPWKAFAQLTRDDATAIALYLRSIPAVTNKVWYIDPKGKKTEVDTGLKFPNGVTTSPDQTPTSHLAWSSRSGK